jgi:hypothetical protein
LADDVGFCGSPLKGAALFFFLFFDAMTQLELCNVALAHLGEARISGLTDNAATARACAMHYEPVLKEVLRSHRWNFAVRRVAVEPRRMEILDVDAAGGLIRVRSTAPHGLTSGLCVEVKNVQGVVSAVGRFVVNVFDADEFDLVGTSFAGSYIGGGSFAVVPAFGWAYQFELPGDCLRVLEVNGSEAGDWISDEWIVEGRWLLTNSSSLRLVYIRDLGDEALTDPLFVQAFGLKLAVSLTEVIRGSSGKTGELLQVYDRVTAPLARRVDANEGRRRKGMLRMNSGFVRSRSKGV